MNEQSIWNKLTSKFQKWYSVTKNVLEPPMEYSSNSEEFTNIPFVFHPFGRFASSYRPNCLPEYNYSAILNGDEGPENYSSECWLEERLDWFSPHIDYNRSETLCADEPDSYSVDENIFSAPCLTSSDYINFYQNEIEQPPPYIDEPPPTYEEATRICQAVSRKFSSTCCLTQVDHVSEWMW